MRKLFFAALFLGSATVVHADAVPGILFNSGTKALNVESVIGSGPDSAFLTVDFSGDPTTPGPAYTWEYRWNASQTSPTETDLLNAVTAHSSLVVDSNTDFGTTFVTNFTNNGFTGTDLDLQPDGSVNTWGDFIGTYNAATQSINYLSSPDGTDNTPLGFPVLPDDSGFTTTLTDGVFYGWLEYIAEPPDYFTPNISPAVEEVSAVPEPTTGVLILGMTSCFLLRKNRRSR